MPLKKTFARNRAALIGLLAITLFCGCGGSDHRLSRAAVSGDVSVDKKPLKSGIIRFVPTGATKGPVTLATIQEGHYAISAADGPALGKHSVEIMATFAGNPVADAVDIEKAWADYAKVGAARQSVIPLPKRYNRKSVLSVDVTSSGDNVFDFQLAGR